MALKVLNLYAGIGGNRKLWKDVKVTAIEIEPKIAKIYQDFFPNDKVIIADAHEYLLKHFKEFDFIWSSPPCPTHSRMQQIHYGQGRQIKFPDMRLYQEILLLKHFFKGKWCVENVIPFYKPLIAGQMIDRHMFWSNFHIFNKSFEHCANFIRTNLEVLQRMIGFDITEYEITRKRRIIRNCVKPELGEHIFNCAFKSVQSKIKEEFK